ncbi:MAG TPA: type VI secretion system contractile sheath large subunit [Pyrinomonadaceae bacterium]|nr:type VI secretion system contractile sheath large subunit [Pyrinomonadaceae bacterium]
MSCQQQREFVSSAAYATQERSLTPSMWKGAGLESFDTHLVATMEDVSAGPAAETPFRLALVGDWSGRASRSLASPSSELRSRRFLIVDRDNLDQVMSKLGVNLHLPVTVDGSLSLTIGFNQLSDFHPDRMVEQLDIFERFRRTRSGLLDQAAFANTAREVREWSNSTLSETTSEQTILEQESREQRPSVGHGSLLDQILEAEPQNASNSMRASDNISAEIRELAQKAVKPHLLPDNDAEREELLAVVDEAIGRELRALMHHPHFQALEAAWRALRFLAWRLETGSQLKLHLLDISRQEFEADLLGERDIESTALYKIFVEQSPAPWALICGNYDFGLNDADARILQRASQVASAAGAPFIAGAKSTLVGCESLAATPDPDDWRLRADAEADSSWNELKKLPSARYLGLGLPRFLIRLPYGKATEPIEEFDFEEFPKDSASNHESYLWANATFAIASLLAQSFSESSWNMGSGDFSEIDGLPLHVYQEEGESHIKPCAETLLTVRAAQKLINLGLMPLISMKNTNVVRLLQVQSIAGTRLAGRWQS